MNTFSEEELAMLLRCHIQLSSNTEHWNTAPEKDKASLLELLQVASMSFLEHRHCPLLPVGFSLPSLLSPCHPISQPVATLLCSSSCQHAHNLRWLLSAVTSQHPLTLGQRNYPSCFTWIICKLAHLALSFFFLYLANLPFRK